MRQMRADAEIELTEAERGELEKVARSRRTAQAVALRARIVLLTADGFAPTAIAEELGTSQPTVRKWRARYVEDGLAGWAYPDSTDTTGLRFLFLATPVEVGMRGPARTQGYPTGLPVGKPTGRSSSPEAACPQVRSTRRVTRLRRDGLRL
jgi:DNA-binding CsgD family transcriptional regulator